MFLPHPRVATHRFSIAALASGLVTLAAASCMIIGLVVTAAPASAETARVLKWADLVPPLAPVARPPRTFFSGATPLSQLMPPADPVTGDVNIGSEPAPPGSAPLPPYGGGGEGAWMSRPRRSMSSAPPAVVSALNGTRVTIGGYVVALDFDATEISEFLLVPFVGACIHVPPPPANQIVYVKMSKPMPFKGQFDPVWVTGTMATEMAFTGLAEAGYTLKADTVAPREP